MKKTLSIILALVMMLTIMPAFAITALADDVVVNYTLTDTCGDGWNTNAILVKDKDSGETVETLTLSSGSEESGTLTLTPGHTYRFVWKSGGYATECGYSFTYGKKVLSSREGGYPWATADMVLFEFTVPSISSVTVNLDANGGTTGALWLDSFEIPADEFEIGSLLNPPAAMITAPEGYVFDGLEVNGVKVNVGETPEIEEGTETVNVKFLWKSPVNPGWNEIDGEWYFYKEDGTMATGWVKSPGSGQWFYLDESGVMQTGWVKVNGNWYYLKDWGAMATGWVHDGGQWYYLKPNGAMTTGWQYIDNAWYFFAKSGRMCTGWIHDGGKWYYCNSDGSMRTADLSYKGKVYRFNKSGVCINP